VHLKRKLRNRVLPVHYRKILRNLFRLFGMAPMLRNRAFAGGKSAITGYEYCATSQHGEDGIIDRIFSQIGFRSRVFIEFGFHPTEANALLLLYKQSFTGLFIDADAAVCALAGKTLRRFVARNKVRSVRAALAPDTIDATFAAHGVAGDIDLLSIDVDGIDYWLWDGISSVSPRVVVVETTQGFGLDECLTLVRDAPRVAMDDLGLASCRGASPLALKELGESKGYCFLGVDTSGVNMFFVRADVPRGDLAVVELAQAFAECTAPAAAIGPAVIAEALARGLLVRPSPESVG
jgi:hypothetical protein